MGYLERKQREKESLKKAILSAALSIAKKEGWQSLTIRKIADAVDYTAPIVYEHFTNKEELISEIINQGYSAMLGKFQDLRSKNMDPKELLMEISLRHWDFAFNNKVLYQLMFSLEREHPKEELVNITNIIREMFSKITNIDGEELRPIIFNWVCLMNGTISTMMMIGEHHQHHHEKEFPLTPKELYKTFIERFLKSIS
jgi:AcrR family transcriptional regulator